MSFSLAPDVFPNLFYLFISIQTAANHHRGSGEKSRDMGELITEAVI